MKALHFLLATALLSWASLAAVAAPPAPPANANFASERGLAFGLRLDGQPLTQPVARQVHVDRLAPGQHWADFSLPTPYGATHALPHPSVARARLRNELRAGAAPRLWAAAAPSGRGAVAGPAYGPSPGNYGGYPPPAPGPNGPGGYYGGQPSAPGAYPGNAPYGGSPSPAGGYGGGGSAPAPNGNYPGSYDPNSNPNNGGYYPGPNTSNYLYPLPPANVQNLTQALRNQPFDDQRLPMVKQALAQGTVRADELAGLINTLSFDRSRIDLAKYGYGHLSDPQNFYRVYDALRYASSVREVQQALGLP